VLVNGNNGRVLFIATGDLISCDFSLTFDLI
jgi:hypothetical protein